MPVGGAGPSAAPEVAPILDLEWPNGTLVKVQARLLNSSFMWPGPIDPWSGTPHPVVLFKFLISNVVSSNMKTQIVDTGPCVCIGPDLRLKPAPPAAPPPSTSELEQLTPVQRGRLADAIFMQTAAAQSKQLYGPSTARQALQTDVTLERILAGCARRGFSGTEPPAARPNAAAIRSAEARVAHEGSNVLEAAASPATLPPDSQTTQPPESQWTQPPVTQPSQPPRGQTLPAFTQATQRPDTQLTLPPSTQTTQPPATQTPPDGPTQPANGANSPASRGRPPGAPGDRPPSNLKRARSPGGEDLAPRPPAASDAENRRADNLDGAALRTTAACEHADGGQRPAAAPAADGRGPLQPSDSPWWGLPTHPEWRRWYQSWLHSQQASLVAQRPRVCNHADLYAADTARATADALLDHWLADNRTLGERGAAAARRTAPRASIELKDFASWQALPLALRADLQPIFMHPLILRDLCDIKPFISKDRNRVLFKLSLKGSKCRNVVLSPELMQCTAGACIAANTVLMARITNSSKASQTR